MTKNRPPNLMESSNADLHRVRDILFGDHQRQVADRIARLEKSLEEQAAVITDLSAELRRQGDSFMERLASAIAEASAGGAESRDRLRDELMSQIAVLRDSKLDRTALARLLGGLADRLGKTGEMPQ